MSETLFFTFGGVLIGVVSFDSTCSFLPWLKMVIEVHDTTLRVFLQPRPEYYYFLIHP